MKNFINFILFFFTGLQILNGQSFTIKETGIFIPQNKKVILLQDSLEKNIIMFKTNLYVNTDGTPLSYHPFDLLGKEKAINTIGNAVAVYKGAEKNNLFLKKGTFNEALGVFKIFRNSNYDSIPEGYSISWQNVLIGEKVNRKTKPCIIKNGEYKGYYSSATSLKNGLTSNKGECDCNDQVNPLKVPSLVMVGGKNNIVKKFGASLGDLVITYNLDNDSLAYAIINDYGPSNNLGEGSVLLNMILSGKNNYPSTRKEANTLSTKNIIVLIIPKSKGFNEQKPYSRESVQERVVAWMRNAGFQNKSEIVEFIRDNAVEFK